MRIPSIVATMLLPALIQPVSAVAVNTYFVGNSLTYDAYPPAVAAVAGTAGHTLNYGFHVQCGVSIQTIWNTPSTCVPSPAPYGEAHAALADHDWDAVTLQPYYDSIGGAKQGINGFINTARARPGNAGTRFLVYSAWPGGSDPTPGTLDYTAPGDVRIDYANEWLSGTHTMTRTFFNQLMAELRAENPGVTIDMVPVGDVLYELDQRLHATPTGGISSVAQLYRDAAHMGYNGQMIAGMTFYSTLYGAHPSTATYGAYGSDSATSALMPLIQDTVWDVVTTHDFTGVPEPACLSILAVGSILLLRFRYDR